LTYIKH